MRTNRKTLRGVALVMFLAAGLASAGIGLATVPDGGGQIHLCYRTNDSDTAGGGAAAILDSDSGKLCKNNQTELVFNQQGPPGPQGATGDTGDTGAPGAAGPSGLANLVRVQGNRIIAAGEEAELIARCPDDHQVVNGGYLWSETSARQAGNTTVWRSAPWERLDENDEFLPPAGWRVGATNHSGDPFELIVIAYCAPV